MGTQTLGNTTANTSHSASWGFSGGQNIMGGGTFTMPQDGYVDSISVYYGATSGTIGSYHVLWDAGTLGVLANTAQITVGGISWKTSNFAAGSYFHMASGKQFHAGVAVNGGVTFNFYPTGDNYAKTGVSTPTSMSGATADQFINGDTNSYLTYFPNAKTTSFTPTVGGIGTTVTFTGVSYSAGVTGVSFNGTAASSYNVVNDTTMTAVVPAGATSGTITITTNAGTAVSSSSFTVAGAYVYRSGVWTPTQGVFVYRSGAWVQATGVFVYRSGAWTPTG